MSGIYNQLNDRNFEQVIRSKGLVVIDFWGDNCGPCKMMEPIIDSVYQKFKGRIIIVKANIKNCSGTAKKYNIMSIPTLILFKKGTPIQRYSGVVRESIICRMIEENI